MLKVNLWLSIVFLLSVSLLSCSDNKQISKSEPPSESVEDTTTLLPTEENISMNNCSLFVEGKELSHLHYVRINHQDNNTEIPIIAVLEQLGASVLWKDKNEVTIEYNGNCTTIDTLEDDFGIPIPPGTTGAVRQIVNNEIIFDGWSVRGLLRNLMGAEIIVDYDSSIINITRTTE